MSSYIFFDDALRIFVNAFLASVFLLIAFSGVGLAIVETVEKSGERINTKR
jgi:hypothetical protein